MKNVSLAALSLLVSLNCLGGLTELKTKYAWPAQRPAVKQNLHGWFYNQKPLTQLLNNNQNLIVELGSWLGVSTIFFLEHAPKATVIAIDHWKGSIEHQHPDFQGFLPTLYETFLVNCWNYRSRLIPLKASTLDGLQEIYDQGLSPDFIYVDAAHDYDSVTKDLEKAYELFPNATLTGDDWNWDSVRMAVEDFIARHNLNVTNDDTFFMIIK